LIGAGFILYKEYTMSMNISSKMFLSALFLGLILPVFVFAEELETTCAGLLEADTGCQNKSTSECQALLEKCAAYYDEQSTKISEDLTKTSQEKKTLQNQIYTLQKKVKNLNAQISQSTVMVKDLGIQIQETQGSINSASSKIEEAQEEIAGMLRDIAKEDKKSSIEVLLEGSLSDFFSNLAYLEGLNSKVQELLDSTKEVQAYLENQKTKMDDEKDELENTIKVQSLQKQESEAVKKQQESYLKLTEAQYQQQLKEKQSIESKAKAIKERIFDLIGVSDAPTFEEAYNMAKYVSGITGVRPAFLLAILTQESNLGKNVGQCYVTNYETGAGTDLKGNAKTRVMSPKTIPSFVELVSSLGMEPKKTGVSCWIPMYSGGVPYGWGGAMGPAQFIISTWNLYKNQVTATLGRSANPWNIKDAFLASGFLLKDNGASTSEFKAAMRYFSGASWTRSEEFYGKSVLAIAAGYADDIAAIEASNK